MAFREIPSEIHTQAGQAMKGAMHGGYEGGDGADLVAAASAMALHKAHPSLLYNRESTPEDYLIEGSREWRVLHSQVARYIETNLNESETLKTVGDGVRQVVNGTIMQINAMRVLDAHRMGREFEQDLKPAQVELFEASSNSPSLKKDLQAIAVGSFERVSPGMTEHLENQLHSQQAPAVEREIERAIATVNQIHNRNEEMLQRIERAGGMLINRKEPDFENTESAYRIAQDGERSGNPLVDHAIRMNTELAAKQYIPPRTIYTANGRLLEDEQFAGITRDPSHLAAMAMSEMVIMRRAEDKSDQIIDMDENKVHKFQGMDLEWKDLYDISRGNYSSLPDKDAERIETMIVTASYAPALDRIKMQEKVNQNPTIQSMMIAHESKAVEEQKARDVRNQQIIAAHMQGRSI